MRSIRLLRVSVCAFTVILALLGAAVVSSATTVSIKVMTYNTDNGSQPDGQLDTIAAQSPDVVVLQEASYTQLSYYVDGLNSRMGTTAWHGAYERHCKYGTQPTCSTWYSGSVMILTRLSTAATDKTLIWAADDYVVARGTIHMRVTKDGASVNVFVCHLPAVLNGSFNNAESARDKYVTSFKQWAQAFSGPQLVGGDFNAHPTTTPIEEMKQVYTDAWAAGGSGYGYTHTNPNVSTRLDYWFANSTGSAQLSSIAVVPDSSHSDHRPVVSTYKVPSTTTTTTSTSTSTSTATTLMSDGFTTLDRTTWPSGVFTGSTDSTIALAANGQFTIGPLKASVTGAHYNGVSSDSYNLTHDGYAYVQLVKPPNTATYAYGMFSVGSDANNYYRWYESADALVAEKRIAGTKTKLVNIPYDATNDQFLRIKRSYNSSSGYEEVVFETAPNSSGVPGTWTVRHREVWDSHVQPGALRFELKAGTSQAVLSPGSVSWDHFKAVSY